MNYSKFQITLDTHSALSQVSIPVPQNDTARRLYVSLTDGGKPFYIEDGCRAVLAATKSDGKYIVNDCIIERNKTIRYEFTEQTTAAIGKIDCTMKLYDSNNELLTSPRFTIVVYESTVPEVTLSENEHTAVDRMLLDEQARVAAEAGRVAAENKRVSDEEVRKQDYIAYKESVDSRVNSMGRLQVSAVEPTDKAIDLWVNSDDEEEFAVLEASDIAQELGEDPKKVISQKAVTDELGELSEEISDEATARQAAIAQERNRAVTRENEIEELFTMPTQAAVNKWLNEHPEATTTVQDNSLTIDKMVIGTLGYVTPQMFGAKGDGVADDTKAFQTAIKTGGCVRVPRGSYKLTTVYVPTGATISGDTSSDDTKLNFEGDGFVLQGNHITIENMSIYGNSVGNGITCTDTTFSYISKIILRNLYIKSFENGINLAMYLSEVSMVNVYYCDKGIVISRGTSTKLYGCYSDYCRIGFEFGATYSTVFNCACDHASECAYAFTSYAENVECIALGAEAFENELIHAYDCVSISFRGFSFFTYNEIENPIIFLKECRHTIMEGFVDRNYTGNTIKKYFNVIGGLNNVLRNSQITENNVSHLKKYSVRYNSNEDRHKFLVEITPMKQVLDDVVSYNVTGSEFLVDICKSLNTYIFGGSLILKIEDLTGNFNSDDNIRIIENIHRVGRVVVTTADSNNKVYDTGAYYTNIRNCSSVFEFKDLTILPHSLGYHGRPYFEVNNAKVIFTNCDFSQTVPNGTESDNMVRLLNCATVIFNDCILPHDTTKLYSKDDSCVVIGA